MGILQLVICDFDFHCKLQITNHKLVLRDLAPHRGGDHAEFVHQRGKLFRVKGLRTIGERFVRLVMNLDEHGISAGGN
jgi:hypothetical protein